MAPGQNPTLRLTLTSCQDPLGPLIQVFCCLPKLFKAPYCTVALQVQNAADFNFTVCNVPDPSFIILSSKSPVSTRMDPHVHYYIEV